MSFLNFALALLSGPVLSGAGFAPGDDQPRFDVARLPVELKKNADAVVRSNMLRFTVTAPGLAQTRVQRAVTVLNTNGREQATLVVFYDRFRELKNLEGVLLDAQGRKIRDLKKNDLNDYLATTSYSLYDDYRARVDRKSVV